MKATSFTNLSRPLSVSFESEAFPFELALGTLLSGASTREWSLARTKLSVFAKQWTAVSAEWNGPRAEQDIASLLRMRSVVLSLLEKAPEDKHLKSSLEAEVDIILPVDIYVQPCLLQLIEREETFLKTLFIVSDTNIKDEGSLSISYSR
ncbi:hypothetical protein F4604DRAFT_1916383 [Suillus subluteus]|nr:hypothetical protein F4604DRAFT_1916383 [Suillus subluteus]